MSICLFVGLSICLSVRHTFSLQLTFFMSPLPEVQCPNCFDIQNPWGKVMIRSGFRFEHFWSKMVKHCRRKKSFLKHFFICSLRLNVFLSKLFRFLESLGKSSGKKWSQIGKLLLIKGVKWHHKKKDFFQQMLPC